MTNSPTPYPMTTEITDMADPLVTAAQEAFSVRLKDSSDVSENTKNAVAIARAWRDAVHRPADAGYASLWLPAR